MQLHSTMEKYPRIGRQDEHVVDKQKRGYLCPAATTANGTAMNETTKLIQYARKPYTYSNNDEVIIETLEQRRRRLMQRKLQLIIEIVVIILLMIIPLPFIFKNKKIKLTTSRSDGNNVISRIEDEREQYDRLMPDWLQESSTVTVRHRPAFPSYLTYARNGPMNVTYDKRSIIINSDRTLFLSGSIHPNRMTPQTWNSALDDAVRHGLNMITVYVFWNVHQPHPGKFDWSLPGGAKVCNSDKDDNTSCQWNLASSIREAASRGLFVHIRIGPYDCAEYNYGGIPEWVPLSDADMEMRRPNIPWMHAMEKWVTAVTNYLTINQLWAYQGGPIILSQIENELGDERGTEAFFSDGSTVNKSSSTPTKISSIDSSRRRTTTTSPDTMQGYADWCGELASRLVPNVVWTMCNGLTAHNTINTCNGLDDSCSVHYLEHHGQTGRIQVDQPALWTENEMGFQLWGEEASKPSDYFWGRTARDIARDGVRWFARGGSHLNYYMWLGGYNRGRAAGAGIMNIYASDAPMCPSGERRQPKFDHLLALHDVLISVAHTLMYESSALGAGRAVKKMDGNGDWVIDKKNQRIFVYGNKTSREVIFVENDDTSNVVLCIPIRGGLSTKKIHMKPKSAAIINNGVLMFDSATISPHAMSYERRTEPSRIDLLLDWKHWVEPRGASSDDPETVVDTLPIEQTELMVRKGVSSDYAWYETDFNLDGQLNAASITIETQKANAMVVFIDGNMVGAVDDHAKGEGDISLSVDVGNIDLGNHTLSILSESLGYFNLIGRWGASNGPKEKGITGHVWLKGKKSNEKRGSWSKNLVDGRLWRSFAGLHGIQSGQSPGSKICLPCTWHASRFDTPNIQRKSFFLDLTGGRGHVWVNGHDLGRFWNITRDSDSASSNYSQRYYFVPTEYLHTDGRLNELVLFNALGSDVSTINTVLSWIAPSSAPLLKDEIDFPNACLI